MNHIEAVRCRRCGRPLHAPNAVAAQYGPACGLRVLQDAAHAPQKPAETEVAASVRERVA